ncbi:MAG: hypothetical protein HN916_11400 [Anaerolineae bacterium]|jgi:hypothetical protein|nr:hypothetical protein [Anaerolineae bacterium]
MKKKLSIILLLSISIGVISTGCKPKSPEQIPEADQPEEPVVIVGSDPTKPLLPDCEKDFETPVIISPTNNEIIDPTPPYTFTWSIACIPNRYNFGVFLPIFPAGSTQNGIQEAAILAEFSSDAPEYTSNKELEPATSYVWGIAAIANNGDVGSAEITGFFTTGPVCAPDALVAPSLISPANGAFENGKGWGNTHEVHITISYPIEDCIPEWYEIDLSLNSDFTGDDAWNVGFPGAYTYLGDNGLHLIEDDTNDLDNCLIYYWRAWAVAGDISGPVSETYNFQTNFEDDCLPASDFKGIKNANCRNNPWLSGNEIGMLAMDDIATLLGLNGDASWGFFRLKNERECWVHMSAVEIQPPDSVFNPLLYPVIEHDPLPESESTA